VPKPAFELTAKKLDAKPAAASPKKIWNKTKASKSTAIQANPSLGEKKAAPAEKTVSSKGEPNGPRQWLRVEQTSVRGFQPTRRLSLQVIRAGRSESGDCESQTSAEPSD